MKINDIFLGLRVKNKLKILINNLLIIRKEGRGTKVRT